MGIQNTTAIPSTVVNAGGGNIPWGNPANATGTGVGSATVATVLSFSITSNVVSFTTTVQNYIAGQTVVVANMFTGTYLNGVTLTILSSGLSTTGFSANFTHTNVSSAFDAGNVTPTTTYATATNFSYVTLTGGQHSLNLVPKDGPLGQAFNGSHQVGPVLFLASSISAMTRGTGGVNGYPIGPPSAGSASYTMPVPTLPSGSTVVAIRPYAMGTTNPGPAVTSFQVVWSGGSGNFTLNGAPDILGSIGTDLNLVPTIQFANSGESTLETQTGYSYGNAIADYGVIIIYTTTGTPIPTALQTLAATGLGLSMAPSAIIVGVGVSVEAGQTAGSGTDTLTAQLTLNGTPVGSVKTSSSLGSWANPVTFGGNGDTWGTTFRGAQVSGASGLGVNIAGTLASGDQINLNSLTVTIYYIVPPVVVLVNVGNTKPLTVGFN